MVPQERIQDVMTEVEQRLQAFETSLPRRVDGIALSPVSKLPFKALSFRESLIWRMTELCRSAFDDLAKKKIASGILLTRAAIETSAALWYLREKLEAAVNSKAVGDIDNYLMRLMMGSRTDTDILPEAISVLTFVDRADRDIEGFRKQYDRLSEIAHPNWAGTTLLYSKLDPKTPGVLEFSPNIRGDATYNIGVLSLSGAMLMFEYSYKKVGDLMAEFVALCENNAKSGGVESQDKP